MGSREILAILDREAENFIFPMLDNGYVYPAAARMSLYRSEKDWALVFEICGYSPRSGAPDCVVTTIAGDPANRRTASEYVSPEAYLAYLDHSRHHAQDFITLIEDDAVFDADCIEYVSSETREVTVRGRSFPIPDAQTLAAAGILQAEDRLLVHELTRYLAHEHRDLMLATENERTAHVPHGVTLLRTYDDWHHPDLAAGELPSSTESFRAVAAMLAGDPVDENAIVRLGNTHWKNWPEGGSL